MKELSHKIDKENSLRFLRPIRSLYSIITDKKEKRIFLIYKEIQMGLVAKSYLMKGFLIYEKMRKHLVIYKEEAVSHI